MPYFFTGETSDFFTGERDTDFLVLLAGDRDLDFSFTSKAEAVFWVILTGSSLI